jgi:hypothetical protein
MFRLLPQQENFIAAAEAILSGAADENGTCNFFGNRRRSGRTTAVLELFRRVARLPSRHSVVFIAQSEEAVASCSRMFLSQHGELEETQNGVIFHVLPSHSTIECTSAVIPVSAQTADLVLFEQHGLPLDLSSSQHLIL